MEIQAPPDVVWQLHIDVNNWPSWQEAITEAHIDGPFEPGSSFDWSSYGFGITSQIYDVGDRSRTLGAGPPEASLASMSGFSRRLRAALE